MRARNLDLSVISFLLLIASCNALPKIRKEKQRVCVIGAGVTGLISAKQLADHRDEFDIVVFEQESDIGGVWLYTDETGTDEHGLPVQSSAYQNLRTNSARQLMAFPDYREFNGEDRSCVSHETVLQYLHNFTDHFDLRQYIQFDTIIEKITPIPGNDNGRTTQWTIQTRKLEYGSIENSKCDAIMVCNGHYSKPKIPEIPGIETFPGEVIHSHVYRKPEVFAGKTVVVLGRGSSGIDIAIDISDYADKVYLSHNKKKIESELPSNLVQVAGVVSASGNELTLKDNSTITADEFIFCTGYLFDYSFLNESTKIYVENKEVQPLYQHIVNIEHPTMGFVAASNYGVTFPVYYVQARYFVSLLRGKVTLPSKEEMMKQLVKDPPTSYSVQWAYANELAQQAGFEPLPAFYEKGDKLWTKHILADLYHFKENNLTILEDGEVQVITRNGVFTSAK